MRARPGRLPVQLESLMTSTAPKIIMPTVGRKVWFRLNGQNMLQVPSHHEYLTGKPTVNSDQPLDATVVYVWSDRMVNLAIFDHFGTPFTATSVPLLQEGDEKPASGYYCEWMPYQTAQAKKEHVVRIEPESEKFGLVSIDSAIEQQIQAAGADKAPRVTPAALKDEIVSEHYFTAADGVTGAKFNAVPSQTVGIDTSPAALHLLTICVLLLRNGFTVHGVSACASPENFNAEIGRQIARENAEREIWPLLGFRLRDELSRPVLTDADAAADLAGTPRP